jgi:hypothetical protein
VYIKSETPYLWINIGVVTEEKVQTRWTDIREAPIYIGQRRYSWQSKEVEVGRYRVGTVSIDFVDAGKNQQIWEGVVQGTLTNDQKRLQTRIDKGIQQIFKRFLG